MNKTNSVLAVIFFIFGMSTALIAQVPEKYQLYLVDYQEVSIDVNDFKEKLENAPIKGLATENRRSSVYVNLPLPDGNLQQFRVVESPILSPDLSAQRSDLKSYIAQGVDDPTANVRFNITPLGLYAVISGINGISYVEPIDKFTNDDAYIAYYDHHILNENVHQGFCESDGEINIDLDHNGSSQMRDNSCFQNGANLRTYDMVVTCSGEFYTLNGGTNALVEAALLNRVAQINAVYEPELAISFTIVEYLLNTNAATDPFTDPTNTSTSLTQVEDHINNNVTVGSWDIGHGFHEITCGGGCGWAGRAGLGVVCTSSKARGYTYLPNDIPTSVTVLLHEVGHMFSCRHSNYGCDSEDACGRYEPGRGSTIMSTSANCDGGDFFANRTDYFGIGSLQAIMDFVSTGALLSGSSSCNTSTVSGWADCAATSATGNNMPDSDANSGSISSLTIPNGTPFTLTGTGTDLDGTGSLTYSWEQYDTDYAGSAAPDDTGASTTAPLFRSFPPSTSPERTCPQLSSILAGNVTTGTGEILPTVARTLTWRFVVRDNEAGGGGIACDEVSLTVGSAGPFRISTQNSSTTWVAGVTQTVMWDVAGTDAGAYTCSNVDILYSSDGGNTFGTTLASNVSNASGSTTITAPVTPTSTGRIKIVCSGNSNIFFDINDVNIVVIGGCTADGGTIANSAAVLAPAGDPLLDLSLAAGNLITMNAGTLDASDPNTSLTILSGSPAICASFGGNVPKYETIEFVVSENTDYTFTPVGVGYTDVLNLYHTSYSAFAGCTNWLNSSYTNGVGSALNFTETLVPATTYVLVSSGFSASNTLGTYTNTFSGSGSIYDIADVPGTGFVYTYVIVNSNTGNIVAIDANSDLSNSGVFTPQNYAVHGLAYLSSENLNVYIGGAFSTLQTAVTNETICGDFSTNSVLVTVQSALPVELTEFRGKLNKTEVLLNWETQSEIDNDYFLVEKSTDGRNFEKLGTVQGAGNSILPQQYNLIDKQPAVGVNYYRLTQFDFDGTFEILDKIVAVDYYKDGQIAVQPNPVKGNQIQLIYQSDREGDLSIEIYNANGQLVKRIGVYALEARNVFEIPLDDLSNGVYFLKTVHPYAIQSLRFVKTN